MSTSERVKQGGPDDALSYTVAEEPPSTVQEMREYLDTLMLEFHDQPVVRRHLSEIMEDYKAHRYGTTVRLLFCYLTLFEGLMATVSSNA